jgi:hypothetical protein
MPYEAGGVDVAADEAVAICTLGPSGVVVQNLGGAPVFLGGESVEAGRGLRLDETDGWQTLPGGYSAPSNIGEAAVPLTLYGITESGKARVGFLRHNLPPS